MVQPKKCRKETKKKKQMNYRWKMKEGKTNKKGIKNKKPINIIHTK